MVIPDISLEFRELNFVILATPARTQLAELALRRAAVPRPCNLEVLQSPSFFFFHHGTFERVTSNSNYPMSAQTFLAAAASMCVA